MFDVRINLPMFGVRIHSSDVRCSYQSSDVMCSSPLSSKMKIVRETLGVALVHRKPTNQAGSLVASSLSVLAEAEGGGPVMPTVLQPMAE
jgi:hypothetical protein